MRILMLSCLVLALVSSSWAEPRKPNIVVIVGDDMGYADIGVHGCKDIPTPHIDSLAAQGIRCTNGYVSGAYCSPTRAGLMTGRYQQRFGHEFNPGPAPPGEFGLSLTEKTLAEKLKAAGYKTGMVGKWHLGNERKFQPMSRGFEEYFGFLGGAHAYFPDRAVAMPIQRGYEPVDEKEYLTDAFAREANAFIDRHVADPFFLYLAFNAVHAPMEATDKYLDRFQGIAEPKRRKYAAMMSAMDDAIGGVLKKLDEHKLAENTLVFFISDNGGPTGANASRNTPLKGVKATLWEGGIRVPYLVRWPGKVPAGKAFDQPVIALDIHSTALAAAGVTLEKNLDGVNLLPHLQGEKKDAPHDALYWRFGQPLAIRSGDWKLIRTAHSEEFQLYNLAADIGEQKDVAAENAKVVAELQEKVLAWDKELIAPKWGPARAVIRAGKGKNKGE